MTVVDERVLILKAIDEMSKTIKSIQSRMEETKNSVQALGSHFREIQRNFRDIIAPALAAYTAVRKIAAEVKESVNAYVKQKDANIQLVASYKAYEEAVNSAKASIGGFLLAAGAPYLKWATEVSKTMATVANQVTLVTLAMTKGYTPKTTGEAVSVAAALNLEIERLREAQAKGIPTGGRRRGETDAYILDLTKQRETIEKQILSLAIAEGQKSLANAGAIAREIIAEQERLALEERLARVAQDYGQTLEGQRDSIREAITLHETWLKDADLTKEKENVILETLREQLDAIESKIFLQEYVTDKAREEWQIRQDTLAIMDEELQKVALYGQSLGEVREIAARTTEEIERQRQEQEKIEKLTEQWKERIDDVTTSFAATLVETKNLAAALIATIADVITQLTNALITQLLAQAAAAAMAGKWWDVAKYAGMITALKIGQGFINAGAQSVATSAGNGTTSTTQSAALYSPIAARTVSPMNYGATGGNPPIVVHQYVQGSVLTERQLDSRIISAISASGRQS